MTKNPQVLIRHLKKQVSTLRRKEKAASAQLKKVFNKMKARLRATEAGAYLKAAAEVERQVRQKVAAKQKMLGRVLSRIEKHFGVKLTKVLHKKAKVSSKRKSKRK